MKASFLIYTLLVGAQAWAGGSDVGNAGINSTACQTMRKFEYSDYLKPSNRPKFEDCLQVTTEVQKTLESLPDIVADKVSEIVTISEDFQKMGNKKAADFYMDYAVTEIPRRALLLVAGVSPDSTEIQRSKSELTQDNLEIELRSRYLSDLTKYREQIYNVLYGSEEQIKTAADYFFRVGFSGGGMWPSLGLYVKLKRDLANPESLFTKQNFYKLVNVEDSCFYDKSLKEDYGPKDAFINSMNSQLMKDDKNFKESMEVGLISEKDFVGKVLAKGMNVSCRYVPFKTSKNYSWDKYGYRQSMKNNSALAKFKPTIKLDTSTKRIVLTKSVIIYDDACDIDQSDKKCVSPKPSYYHDDDEEVAGQASGLLEKLRASLSPN